MHIAVACPRCESRYQVDDGLRGKRMRCPNPLCRHIFEVPRAEAPAPPAAAEPAPPLSGSVSDVVPLLPAQLAETTPAPAVPVAKKSAEASKPRAKEPVQKPAAAVEALQPPPVEALQPPPVRANPSGVAVHEAPAAGLDDFPGDDETDAAPALGAEVQELGPGMWEAPPVRLSDGLATANGMVASVESVALAPPVVEPPSAERRARRRALLALAALVCAGGIVTSYVWWTIEQTVAGNEVERAKRAQALYEQHDFAEAAEAFQKLSRDFAGSADASKYRFMAEWSGVRGEAAAARDRTALKPALDHVLEFVSFNASEPLLKEHHAEVWQTLHGLTHRLVGEAETQHDRAALDWARQAWSALARKGITPPSQVSVPEQNRQMDKDFARVDQELQDQEKRQALIATLQDHIAHASAARVQAARSRVAVAGLKDDPEIAKLLAELVQAHRDAIRYVPAGKRSASPAPDDDTLPSLLVTPALTPAKLATGRGGSVVLSLARGVLYAFDPMSSALRWARRVGVDTSILPLHVPADPITPELVLVVSSDRRTVSALVAESGTAVWQHVLEQPCIGQPVLVGRSLLVPTIAGRIDEVETSGGRLLGYYDVGQRLSVGGARQEGTSLVYFPGDSFCVYVLDVAKRQCAAVLYANHPAGSLRGVPILVRGRLPLPKEVDPAKGPTGWLLLCQAKGTADLDIRPFELPIRTADQPPAEPILHVPGSAWFPPYHDAEKLAVATDAGRLSLWGIRQKGNRDDPLLFRLLGDDYLVGTGPGRAQVVHADADNYWVLTGGVLHRLQNVFRPHTGPDLLPAWPQPPTFGSPLHAAQHRGGADGQASLFLTTLASDWPTCLCSAVDAASGHVAWQRQLGCVPIHAPVVLDGRVLLRDATGLLSLDPAVLTPTADKPWQQVPDFVIREPLAIDEQMLLLSAANEAVQLTWPASSGTVKLRVRHVPARGASTTEVHELPAPPAGTPALGAGCVILPLANGIAARLDFGSTITAGPNWRAAGVDEQAPGHIVALGGDEYLLTDGGRGLTRIAWPGKNYQQRGAPVELSNRIVAAPAVLALGSGRQGIVVADAADTLTLLDGDRLQELRRWTLPGKITAGPFVRGSVIVCVVDHKRLTWLDPDGDDTREYAMVANIVGAPVLVEGMLIAVDVSGRIAAFDPQTGSPLGAGYTLHANTAPETAPVPFGPGRLLVPLNDGTLLLVPLAKLRGM